jgi:hypothetical protein
MSSARHVACTLEVKTSFKILVGKSEGKRRHYKLLYIEICINIWNLYIYGLYIYIYTHTFVMYFNTKGKSPA